MYQVMAFTISHDLGKGSVHGIHSRVRSWADKTPVSDRAGSRYITYTSGWPEGRILSPRESKGPEVIGRRTSCGACGRPIRHILTWMSSSNLMSLKRAMGHTILHGSPTEPAEGS